MNINKLRFDTVKFTTDTQYLISYNSDVFKHDVDIKSGEIISAQFSSLKGNNILPFQLYISANFQTKRMIIEFSSKLLLEAYPQLISIETFKECLMNIEKLGICKLDEEKIMDDCLFSKLHITRDIPLNLTPKILDTLNACTNNYRRYTWKRYENHAIRFTSDIISTKHKEEFIIYNKGKEITQRKNSSFLNMLANKEEIVAYFSDKTRFEVKLESRRKIKDELKIADTSFKTIFELEDNVVLRKFDKLFAKKSSSSTDIDIPPEIPIFKNITDYGLINTIKLHNGDIKKIEQEIRSVGIYANSSRSAMSKQMTKIKGMIQMLNNQELGSDTIIDEIRNTLIDETVTAQQ